MEELSILGSILTARFRSLLTNTPSSRGVLRRGIPLLNEIPHFVRDDNNNKNRLCVVGDRAEELVLLQRERHLGFTSREYSMEVDLSEVF